MYVVKDQVLKDLFIWVIYWRTKSDVVQLNRSYCNISSRYYEFK